MSHYPPGMTDAHWAYLDGSPDPEPIAQDFAGEVENALQDFVISVQKNEGIKILDGRFENEDIYLTTEPAAAEKELELRLGREVEKILKPIREKLGATIWIEYGSLGEEIVEDIILKQE